MNQKTRLEKLKIYIDIAFVSVIVLLVISLNINTSFKFIKDNPSTENRLPATITAPESISSSNILPTLSYVKNFPQNFDLYYSDNFSLRNRIIQDYSSVKFNVLNEGNKGAIKGKDGWLYGGIPDVDNHNQYCNNFSTKVEGHLSFFKANLEFLKSLSIGYYIFIPPKKETVYPEYLPTKISDLICSQNHTDIIVESLGQDSKLVIVDPKKTLIANKTNKDLYYKTDTHWNEDAAFIATTELLQAIAKNSPSIKIPTIKNFEVYKSPVNKKLVGDLSRFMSIPWLYEDASRFDSYLPQSTKQFSYQPLDAQMNPTGDFIEYQTYTLPAAQRFRITNPKALNTKKVLIFRDSFTWATVPFFTETFSQVDYVFLGDGISFDKDIVDQTKPDIVIHQFLEKKL